MTSVNQTGGGLPSTWPRLSWNVMSSSALCGIWLGVYPQPPKPIWTSGGVNVDIPAYREGLTYSDRPQF